MFKDGDLIVEGQDFETGIYRFSSIIRTVHSTVAIVYYTSFQCMLPGIVRRQYERKSYTYTIIRKVKHKAVINFVKQCISNNSTRSFVCCNIHFQKYPLFFEKLFKCNRNS